MATLPVASITLRPKPSPAAAVSSTAASPVCSLRRLSVSRRLPSLRLSSRHSRRRRGGALCATAVDAAAESYARALADVAQAGGTLDATVADLEKVEKVFADEGVASFFANPTIPASEKKEVLAEVVKSSKLQQHVANFLELIVEMGRSDILSDIIAEFETAYNALTGTELAIVSSVVLLESQDLAQIAQAVQQITGANNVRIKTVIDESLIAGFTIRFGPSGSSLIDMSVKKQIDEIASQLELPDVSLATV